VERVRIDTHARSAVNISSRERRVGRAPLSGHQKGQSQTLVGTDNQDNTIFGDAYSLVGFASGGNDLLIGGNNTGGGDVTNTLYGDAYQMSGHAHGGADTLIGGTDSGTGNIINDIYGDAYMMSGSAHGGHNHLTGGDSSTSSGQSDENRLYGAKGY
jgi:hypothetical protein